MVEARPPITHSDRPRVTLLINDNYCVPQWGFVDWAGKTNILPSCQTLKMDCQTETLL